LDFDLSGWKSVLVSSSLIADVTARYLMEFITIGRIFFPRNVRLLQHPTVSCLELMLNGLKYLLPDFHFVFVV